MKVAHGSIYEDKEIAKGLIKLWHHEIFLIVVSFKVIRWSWDV